MASFLPTINKKKIEIFDDLEGLDGPSLFDLTIPTTPTDKKIINDECPWAPLKSSFDFKGKSSFDFKGKWSLTSK